MGGVLAGINAIPLTSILLVFAVTGDYHFILPLMFVSIISYLVVIYVNRGGTYTLELMKEGIDVSKRGEMDLLGKIKVKELRKTDFNVVSHRTPFRKLTDILMHSTYGDVFVLDERSYRGPNGANLETEYGPASYFLGPEQMAWLKRELLNSRATWKVIASDMPLSLIVYDDATNKKGSEAFAQGDGPARGRELEIADILRFIKLGAAGVQMGTRFVATHECDADDRFKQSYIDAKEKDVVIIKSPVGMPGRALHNEFLDLAAEGEKTPARCPYRCIHTCDYTKAPYCITLALANAKKGRLRHGFAFAGQNAWRVDRIMSVADLFKELIEGYEAAEAASPA